MYYAGIDAHRSYLTVAIVDASGEVVRERKRVPIGDGEPLLEALDGLRPLKAVVETCPFWPWIHDTLEPTEVDFHLAHASKVEAIGKSMSRDSNVYPVRRHEDFRTNGLLVETISPFGPGDLPSTRRPFQKPESGADPGRGPDWQVSPARLGVSIASPTWQSSECLQPINLGKLSITMDKGRCQFLTLSEVKS